MNLLKKKQLASRTYGIGKDRIIFNNTRLAEIKEAITKQDIKDLVASGAIKIREIHGRKTVIKRKTRRRYGSKKKVVRNRKREYISITRKLRSHLNELKKKDKVTPENFKLLRKEIRTRNFDSKHQLKERLEGLK